MALDFRPNTASLDFDTLLKCMQERTNHNPLFVVESVDFLSEVKELEAKRDRERDEACEEAASEEAKVRKRRGERLQEIDGRYNMLLSDARRRYLESLTSRPEGGTDAGISSSPGPTSGIRVGAESSTLIATHTHSLPDSSPGGHDSALRLSSDTLNSFTSPRNDPPLQYDAPQTSSDVDLSNILDGGYEWDASMLSQSLYYEMDETMVSVEGQKDTSQ